MNTMNRYEAHCTMCKRELFVMKLIGNTILLKCYDKIRLLRNIYVNVRVNKGIGNTKLKSIRSNEH